MGFEDAESIFIDNKEVQSIVVKDSGGILFEKREVEPLIFTFTGTELTQNSYGSFSGTNMYIDYGDGTVEATTGKFGHTYEESGTYTVKIYGITSLGQYCFRDCTGLTSIDIPDSITSLGHHCFWNCTSLTSIVIPDSVTSLGSYCFQKCSSLTSISIPESISSLENGFFFDCSALTSVNIPSSVISIGEQCFANCSRLISISIPNNVSSIGKWCFDHCSGLTSIILNWNTSSTIPTYDSNWIRFTSSSLKFLIPQGTTSLYIDKGYPSEQLEEVSFNVNINNEDLSGDEEIE